ncbi:unnamed protein product [Trichobilharzia regenti]|nr:unnamed protein product [Trichobilharzia regenti]
MSILLILLITTSTTTTQYEFKFSKLFNPVDASSLLSEKYLSRLSRNNQHFMQSLYDNANKWGEQGEVGLLKSDRMPDENADDNGAAYIHTNDNHINSEASQLMIEKYKRKLLRLLNLKSPPNVNVNNESEWNSLPILLRNRLKAEIDASNQLINKPIDNDDEEKGTLILLNQYKLPIKLPNPNIFTLKVAEEIDPMHISRVTLHIEVSSNH